MSNPIRQPDEGAASTGGNVHPRILFSTKDDWEPHIRARLRDFEADFRDFSDPHTDYSGYAAVFPLTLAAAARLHIKRDAGEPIPCLLPKRETIALCNDKVAFNRFLRNSGFAGHVPETGKNIGFPYILKTSIDEWGRSSVLIENEADEAKHAAKLRSSLFFKQVYVSSKYEYACHLLMLDGRITFARAIEFEFPHDRFVFGKWAEPDILKEINHSRFYPLFQSILEAVGYQGFCCIDYKLDADGQPAIFELNPRMGGSLRYFINNALRAYIKAIGVRG